MILYHYTHKRNLSGIMVKGLVPAGGVSPYYRWPYVPAVPETKVWLDKKGFPARSRGWVVLAIDTDLLVASKLERYDGTSWYTYEGVVPVEAITVVTKER